jgi:methyl-accepting chemotaxis protein
VVSLINDKSQPDQPAGVERDDRGVRAGDCGQRASPWSGEDKTLANQTAKATEEIGGQIASGAVSDEKRSVGRSAASSRRIDEIAHVSRRSHRRWRNSPPPLRKSPQRATGRRRNPGNFPPPIAGVSQAVGETGAASRQMLEASQSLSQEANGLKSVVEEFLHGVRAA